MSESTDKILASERPNNDEGWIEYALSLGWEELPMGYEYVTNNAAAELSALRAEVGALKEAARRFLNSLPIDEINLAREVWGNTNTIHVIGARIRLVEALNAPSEGQKRE